MDFEPPNLDCLWPDDLDQLARVFLTLHQYANMKAHAMRFRTNGDLRKATTLENRCDRLYKTLPHWARW